MLAGMTRIYKQTWKKERYCRITFMCLRLYPRLLSHTLFLALTLCLLTHRPALTCLLSSMSVNLLLGNCLLVLVSLMCTSCLMLLKCLGFSITCARQLS